MARNQMLYRDLRDRVRRQIEGNVTVEMVATPSEENDAVRDDV